MILIVDDEPSSRAPLSKILRAQRCQVRLADGGELALASAAAQLPELILLDIRMPGIDGFEVCRRHKADPDTRLVLRNQRDREEGRPRDYDDRALNQAMGRYIEACGAHDQALRATGVPMPSMAQQIIEARSRISERERLRRLANDGL